MQKHHVVNLLTSNGAPVETPALPVVSTDPIVLRTVSPSQLKEADPENGCLRQWYLRKVGKVHAPEKPWLQTGTNIHSPIETYLRTGALPDETDEHYFKVLAAREYLPTPGSDLLVEFAAKLPTYEGGPTFSLKVDLADPRDPTTLVITDHKSTSDIHNRKGNLLTPETLLTDPQMMSYAYWGYQAATHENVRVGHFYISSTHKGRVNPPVYVDVPRETSDQQWNDALVQIRTMQSLAEKPIPWQDVPPRKKASTCSKYGGCPYLALCTSVDPWIGVSMTEGVEASDFLSQLKALAEKGGKAYDDTPTPTKEEMLPEPQPEEVVATEILDAGMLLVELKGEAASIDVPLLPPDAPSRMTPAVEEKPKREKKAKVTAIKNTPHPQWEYDIDRETVSATVELLNARGKEGWELIGFDGNAYVYKREVR